MFTIGHATILLVDDDSEQVGLLTIFLNRLGFSTATACDGQEALEQLLRCYALPSLILLDPKLPRMDGWEFLERKRNDPELASIPVVVITDHRADAPKNIPALSKPVNLRNLALAANFYCSIGSLKIATKQIIDRSEVTREPHFEEKWLDVQGLAEAEITSKDSNFPIRVPYPAGKMGTGFTGS